MDYGVRTLGSITFSDLPSCVAAMSKISDSAICTWMLGPSHMTPYLRVRQDSLVHREFVVLVLALGRWLRTHRRPGR